MKKDLSKLAISPNCTGIETKNDISEMRGMSDPVFFSFNIQEHSNVMVCHGICFVSLVMHPSTKIELLSKDGDPRVEHLLKFIWSNFLKEKRAHLTDELGKIEKLIKEDKAKLEALSDFIKSKDDENQQ